MNHRKGPAFFTANLCWERTVDNSRSRNWIRLMATCPKKQPPSHPNGHSWLNHYATFEHVADNLAIYTWLYQKKKKTLKKHESCFFPTPKIGSVSPLKVAFLQVQVTHIGSEVRHSDLFANGGHQLLTQHGLHICPELVTSNFSVEQL